MTTAEDRLADARKELLDLGLRNPLLNYRPFSARGLTIINERPFHLHTHLVTNGRSFTFLPQTDAPAAADAHADDKLQTSHDPVNLQKRLLTTQHVAQTVIEESGINTLYLALGMLRWQEPQTPNKTRRAPLILLPVTLSRSSASAPFRLRHSGAEPVGNLSLEAKLRIDFGLALPLLPTDNLDVDGYFAKVGMVVSPQTGWSVDFHAVALGFFSFTKYFMLQDLDPTSWPAEQQPTDHPILYHLLSPSGFPNHPTTQSTYIPPTHVVDADSSQAEALTAVRGGQTLVIQGPPGTGKSQTITNVLADALAQGKTVLFVSEKMAALDVVKRRLDAVGLGVAALPLHSPKATKADLMADLAATFALGQPQEGDQPFANADALHQTRQRLDSYAQAINQEIGQSGVTPHEAIGRLVQLRQTLTTQSPNHPTNQSTIPPLTLPQMSSWGAATFTNKLTLIEALATLVQQIGQPAEHPFADSPHLSTDSQQPHQIEQAAKSALASLHRQHETAVSLTTLLQIPPVADPDDLHAALEIGRSLLHAPNLYGLDLTSSAWRSDDFRLRTVLEAGMTAAILHEQYSDWLIPNAWQASDLLAIRKDLVTHGDGRLGRLFSRAYRTAQRQLRGYCRQALPDSHEEMVALVDAVLVWQQQRETILRAERLLQKLLGNRWQGMIETDWATVGPAGLWLVDIHAAIARGTAAPQLLTLLTNPNTYQLLNQLESQTAALQTAQASHASQLQRLAQLTGISLASADFATQQQRLARWAQAAHRFPEVAQINQLQNQLAQAGLAPVWDALSTPHFADARWQRQLVNWFRWHWFQQLAQRAQQERPALAGFKQMAQETAVAQFQTLDQENLRHNQQRLAHAHWQALPQHDAGGLMGLLLEESGKKRNHMPLRQLIEQTAPALQRIKPIFMMSPLSIAVYLPPGKISFDLVVFDEASQVRPVEAFGAILRGRQAVVVGDSRQLPPTTFFDRVLGGGQQADDDEWEAEPDELGITASNESILDLFVAQGAPQQMLRWHYRSQHESLIALSNQLFYNERLLLFPSPDAARESLGLTLHHLPDAVYERGRSRTNPLEAVAIAEAVMQHAAETPELTLGVATFSSAQRTAIEEALEPLRQAAPELEPFFQAHPTEPFFIKNLENVQGDERDVILVSVGYGKTAESKLNLNFGPLNPAGGERRLNVLLTRARRRCILFCNFKASDIDLRRTDSAGVRGLRAALAFAETGQLEQFAPQQPSRPAPLLDEVADWLTEQGHDVARQVGHNGVVIDVAVRDPQRPNRFVVGLLGDGAAYEAAGAPRDRDRIQPAVLRSLGWRPLRVWSDGWLDNPLAARQKLLTAVSQALQPPKAPNQRIHPSPNPPIPRYAPKPLKARVAPPFELLPVPFSFYARSGWEQVRGTLNFRSSGYYRFDLASQQFVPPQQSYAELTVGLQEAQSWPDPPTTPTLYGRLLFDCLQDKLCLLDQRLFVWDGYWLAAEALEEQRESSLERLAFAPHLTPVTEMGLRTSPSKGLAEEISDEIWAEAAPEATLLEAILRHNVPLLHHQLQQLFVQSAADIPKSQRRNLFTQAKRIAQQRGLIAKRGDFFFAPQASHVVVQNRREVRGGYRHFGWVSEMEVMAGVEQLVGDALAIEPQALIFPLFKLLGYGRLGIKHQQRAYKLLGEMMKNGRLHTLDNFVTLPSTGSHPASEGFIDRFMAQMPSELNRPASPLELLAQQLEQKIQPYAPYRGRLILHQKAWQLSTDKGLLLRLQTPCRFDVTSGMFVERELITDLGDSVYWDVEPRADSLGSVERVLGKVSYDMVTGEFVHFGFLAITFRRLLRSDKLLRAWRDPENGRLLARRANFGEDTNKKSYYFSHASVAYDPQTDTVTHIPTQTTALEAKPIAVADALGAPVRQAEADSFDALLAAESPLHFSQLVVRYERGLKNQSARVEQMVERLVNEATVRGTAVRRGNFVWRVDQPPVPRSRRPLAARWHSLEFIAPEEIEAAVLLVLRAQSPLAEKELTQLVSHLLINKKRLGKKQLLFIKMAVARLISQQQIVLADGEVSLQTP